MKTNRLKQLLLEGKVPVGHMVMEFATRGMPGILEAAGVDFAVVDTEHAGFSSRDVADLMAGFKATRIAPLVRVPEIQYHFIARTLDAGALGIMVPCVESAAQAREVVRAAKYAPLGRRGVGLGLAHTDFRSVDPRTFMESSNANTTIILQIESVEGLGNLDEIASEPGVDILWVGHFDLTQSMGIPGDFGDARFVEALERVVGTAREHGLGAGIQPRTVDQAREWMHLGFNVISYGADLFVYIDAMKTALEALRRP